MSHTRPIQLRGPVALVKAEGTVRTCEVEGCTRWTRGGKPNCPRHFMGSAYARRIAELWNAPVTHDHPKALEVLKTLEEKAPDLPEGWHRIRETARAAELDTREIVPILDALEAAGLVERATFFTANRTKLRCSRLPRSA